MSSKSRGQMCCVYACHNCRYDKENSLTGVHFFNIPKSVLSEKKLRERWCTLIKRQDGRDGFTISPRTVICHEHFRESDIKIALNSKRWSLKPEVEPSVFKWSKACSRKPPKERIPLSPLKVPAVLDDHDEIYTATPLTDFNFYYPEEVPECDPGPPCVTTEEKACQTDPVLIYSCDEPTIQPTIDLNASYCDHSYSTPCKGLSELEVLREQLNKSSEQCDQLMNKISELNTIISEFEANRFSLEKICDDKHAVMFYTGFPNIDAFNAFFNYTEAKSERLNYWRGRCESGDDAPKYQVNNTSRPGKRRTFSTKEELFMVLVRLKVGLFVRDISERFGISQGYFSKIFTTWINFLHHELPLLFPFPSQQSIRRNLPMEFTRYPTTRIILDCTEIFIEVSSVMETQSQTWSSYKHNNTLKVLVGISPNGTMTYISGLWGGKTSDKEITAKCGILNLLEPGDNIMADRGFDIKTILPEGVGLNIPPFLNGRSQLSADEVKETMDIASVRIHVEREIGRIKNYHILDGVMPLSLTHIAGQIVSVVAYLTNFLPPLLPPAHKQNKTE